MRASIDGIGVWSRCALDRLFSTSRLDVVMSVLMHARAGERKNSLHHYVSRRASALARLARRGRARQPCVLCRTYDVCSLGRYGGTRMTKGLADTEGRGSSGARGDEKIISAINRARTVLFVTDRCVAPQGVRARRRAS